MDTLINALIPPIHSDLGKTQKASFLHYAYIVIMVAFLVFGFLNLSWEAYSLGKILLLFAGICLIGFILNKIKFYYLSAALITTLVYAGTYYNIIDGAAFHDPGVAALPVIILLSGILFLEIHVFITTILSILGLIAIYYLWSNGFLELSTPPTMNRLTILVILQVLTGILTGVVFNIQRNTITSLVKSEERYRELVDNINDLVYRYEFTPVRGFTYVSPSATRITGYTPMDHYLDPDLGMKLVHPEDRHLLEDLSGTDDEFTNTLTLRWVKKDGSEIWTEQNNTPIYDTKGNLIAVEGIARDITAQKESERVMQESAERNRAFFEESPLLNWQYTIQPPMPTNLPIEEQIEWILHKSTLTDINLDTAITSRSSKGSVTGKTLFENWGKSDSAGKKIIRDFVEDHYSLRMYETSEDTIDKPIWSIINAFGVIEDDHMVRMWGTTLDITERRKADDALRASEDRYRTIFENAAVGISIHTGDIFIDINKAWQEMFGYNKEDVLGNTPFDYSPIKQPDGQISSEKGWNFINQASAGQDQLFDWRHTRADGTEFDAEIFMTVINLSGEEVMISFVSDLTERRRAEAAAQEERQRLAHELHDAVSQTLFSASMISQTLERSWDRNPELVRENLKELQILTQGALAEMRNLLLELRPGALEHTPMPDLLNQLVEGFLGRTMTDIDLRIDGENPLPFNTRFVFFRIAQEALNNIIKHARATKVNVGYSSQLDKVELSIEDDGKGFDPQELVSGQHGLDIMKERADSINAVINIDSKVGEGTAIKVTWQP